MVCSINAALMVYWQLAPYVSDGPTWRFFKQWVDNSCDSNWWKVLLYVQNLTEDSSEGNCMAWYVELFAHTHTHTYERSSAVPSDTRVMLLDGYSKDVVPRRRHAAVPRVTALSHYLPQPSRCWMDSHSYDMRLRHGSTPLLSNGLTGYVRVVCALLACIGSNLGIAWDNDLYAYPFLEALHDPRGAPPGGDIMTLIYMKPWTRAGPYLVGFISAYITLDHGGTAA